MVGGLNVSSAVVVPSSYLTTNDVMGGVMSNVHHPQISSSILGVLLVIMGLLLACVGSAIMKPMLATSGFLTGAMVAFLIVARVNESEPLGRQYDLAMSLSCLAAGE